MGPTPDDLGPAPVPTGSRMARRSYPTCGPSSCCCINKQPWTAAESNRQARPCHRNSRLYPYLLSFQYHARNEEVVTATVQ